MDMKRIRAVTLVGLVALLSLPAGVAMAPNTKQPQAAEPAQNSDNLEEIQRQLENPLTSLWSLTLQENLRLNRGDLLDGTEISNVLFFQPVMPVSLGANWILVTRPVFPLVTNLDPILAGDDVALRHTTGLGDLQLFSVLGPKRTDGVIYGGGATFKFPTATSDVLGQGKYQAGPAAILAYLGKDWPLASSLQHWWSYAGSRERPATSQTDIGYAILRRLEHGWSLGMTPTINIDWKADSGDQLTLPVGLGVTKMTRWRQLPVRLRFEVQYSVIRPDSLGTEWNFRVQIVPVIPSPLR